MSVLVGLAGASATTLHATSQPIPRPIRGRAVIDTAATVSAVVPAIPSQLGITPAAGARTLTAAGSKQVALYQVSLSILDETQQGLFWVFPDLLVTELPPAFGGIDALVGMDVLSQGPLVIDGPARHFTLAF